ncbi:MAG: DEAD/DEAH box helicase [Gammaproteobacteria bacterium]|nr:DEAD/DEAH box helicase [Gammaproteobacteria bacterium]MCP5135417.1 DEAD/DEAH box helicase [Gammaproteobacteria bacterium]
MTTQAQPIPLQVFVNEFGSGLLEAVRREMPPIFDGHTAPDRDRVLDALSRQPFPPQRDRVQAVTRLLVDENQRAAVINAEMGTGKTMMAICTAAVMHAEGYRRTLVLSPPHLVYKWRREILETVPGARVEVLNGPDTLAKLLRLRAEVRAGASCDRPTFYVLGRVRMRLGFHWRPAPVTTRVVGGTRWRNPVVCCPSCGAPQKLDNNDPMTLEFVPTDRRLQCQSCHEPLWTLKRQDGASKSRADMVKEAMCSLPTVGPKTAGQLLDAFGEDMLATMLEDNVYGFLNLMDEDGDLVFNDRRALRMERALARTEISFGQGGFQASEFIKRHLRGVFGLCIVDEGHEYKNQSAQGEAFGVVASQASKVLMLTGTLMGGYADDLFYLLWRMDPGRMIAEGFRANDRGSLGPAQMAFMRTHGVLKDIYTEVNNGDHKTSRGKKITVRTQKAPGFGPAGIVRMVLPITVFLKLKEIGGDVLPAYDEELEQLDMTPAQETVYSSLAVTLKAHLNDALRAGDHSLMGVVLNALLAWPDTCFREEVVKHPHTRQILAKAPALFDDATPTPKEEALIDLCREEKANGRRVLVYTTYTGTRDTTTRLKRQLSEAGLTAAVLKSSVSTEKREDWILEQVDRGIDVLICNPELVKTGLDLLQFPTVVFLQTGYNVYTVQQAARRSWRIGQTEPVRVIFMGYAGTAQEACLALMAQKIAVSQSTSGDIPETGLEALNPEGDSIEVALAKQLVA